MGILSWFKRERTEDDAVKFLRDAGAQVNELAPLSSKRKPPAIDELRSELGRKTALWENGQLPEEEAASLAFLKSGLAFIDIVRENYGLELTLAEQDVVSVEVVAGMLHRSYTDGDLPDDYIMRYARPIAGYLGLLVQIHKGGEWVLEVEEMKESGPAIRQANGQHYFLLGKVYRRIQDGAEDNLAHFYRWVKYSLD